MAFLTFLTETRKIKIVEKLVANLHSKKEYAIHIRNLKQPLNQQLNGLLLKTYTELLNSTKKLG